MSYLMRIKWICKSFFKLWLIYIELFLLIDDDFDDNDLFVFARHKPGELEHLCKETKFTKKEIRLIYQGFKQVRYK